MTRDEELQSYAELPVAVSVGLLVLAWWALKWVLKAATVITAVLTIILSLVGVFGTTGQGFAIAVGMAAVIGFLIHAIPME